jgi:hypothetical protein
MLMVFDMIAMGSYGWRDVKARLLMKTLNLRGNIPVTPGSPLVYK